LHDISVTFGRGSVYVGTPMNTLLQDLRFSFRLLAKAPGFTAIAIIVLALGIGVNTGLFSVVYEILFGSRGFPRPAEVVQIYSQDRKSRNSYAFSHAAFTDIRSHNDAFAGVLALSATMVGIGETGDTRRAFASVVSSNYFDVFGVSLVRGRNFTAAEEKPGAAIPVAIASHALWKRHRFDPNLIGQVLRVNGRQFTIIGIAPERFTGPSALVGPELYFPLGCFDLLMAQADSADRRTLERLDSHPLILVGRLKPGVSLAAGEAALQPVAVSLASAAPAEEQDRALIIRPLRRLDVSTSPRDDSPVTIFGLLVMSVAGIVLLIACLNLANMLLARGAARRREIAIRLAVGGARSRILRQLLTEGLVLALAGGISGLLLSVAVTRTIAAQVPFAIAFRGDLNPALFAAALGFCALATVFFGLGPALKLSRADVLPDLKGQAGEDPVKRRRHRWLPRNLLVVAQIALSLGLLTTAALFIRGAVAAARVDTGFAADDTLLIEVDASLGGYDTVRGLDAYNRTRDRLAGLPGVQAAGIAALVPLGMNQMDRPVRRAGTASTGEAKPMTPEEGRTFGARWNSVGTDYFAAVGVPILRGRAFTKVEAEAPGGPPVAIIDEALARKLWPDGDALGQRVEFGGERSAHPQSLEIVGIVPTTRMELFQSDLGSAIYVPFAQGFQSNAFFHVRASRTDAGLVDLIRRELALGAPGVPVFAIKTFRQHLDGSLQVWIVRLGAALFSTFGGLALMLAVVGVYGVKAYSVARRTREIGIRMALGAKPRDVFALIIGEGAVMIVTGTAIGLLLALALGHLLSRVLYEVSPVDPWAFTFAPITLIVAALVACWLPARRATKVSPLTALRTE
jgi:predicted permease